MEEDIFALDSIDLRVSEQIRDIGIQNEYKTISKDEYMNSLTVDDFETIEKTSEYFMQDDAKTITEAKNYIVL